MINSKDGTGGYAARCSFKSQPAAAAYLQQHYRNEIERVMDELKALLPAYRKQLGGRTYYLAQANSGVLTTCYATNSLGVPAPEVLLEHLLTLSHMLTHKLSPD